MHSLARRDRGHCSHSMSLPSPSSSQWKKLSCPSYSLFHYDECLNRVSIRYARWHCVDVKLYLLVVPLLVPECVWR